MWVDRSEKNNMNRILVFFFTFYMLTTACFAVDFSIRPKVYLSFPTGAGNITPDGYEMYNMGWGGEIGAEIDLSTIWSNPLGLGYTTGLEGGFLFKPFRGDTAIHGNILNLNYYSIGICWSLYYFPLSRLFTRIDGNFGMYQSSNDMGITRQSAAGMYWRLGGEGGFRFTPGFLLAANAGWRQYEEGWSFGFLGENNRTMNSGFYLGLTAQITFQTGSNNDGISAVLEQNEAVYPAFMQAYQDNAVGNVVIRNNENAEIRDVQFSFRASSYTASEYPFGSASIIQRGRSIELPLLADFSPEILRFTDNGRIIGEIVIRYRFLGQQREAVNVVTIATHNRNKIKEDGAAFAAFISPTSLETLDFARFIAGLARANRLTGHNQNMQYAVWLLEGLRASGIIEKEILNNEGYVQFPAETLLFRSGTTRDLSLLFASCLEGVGIRSAFIQTEDNFLIAFNLGMNQAAAQTFFNGTENILIINDTVWLPLSMDAYNDGFFAAWKTGVSILNESFAAEKAVDFIIVEDAWAVYPPAPLPELGRNIIRTDNEIAKDEFNKAMREYITQEIIPIIQITQNRDLTVMDEAARLNRLGILNVRAGLITEGKTAYERAADLGSIPAMTNRGNLALIERDFDAAQRWFNSILELDSGNRAAIRGLERVEGSR